MSEHAYSGEPIDVSWQTPPWQNKGETLDAYDSEGDGEIMTVDWPENATDPEELNDRQKKMILTAVNYPDVDSPKRLVELSGLDVSHAYPRNVLSAHWPERYWGADDWEQSDSADIDLDELRQRLLDGASLNKLVKEYPASQERLSQLVRGEAEDAGGCDTPPLEWLGNGEQRWIIPEEYYDEPVETNYDNKNRATITEPISELRRRALAGETANEIANDHGVADRTIRKRLKGQYGDNEADVPPLEYDKSINAWRTVDEEFENDGEQDIIDTDSRTVELGTPDQDSHDTGTPAWAWAVVGAVAAWFVSKILR